MARFHTEIKLFLKCRQMFLQETSKVFDYIIVIFIVAYFLKCSLSLAYNAYLLVMFQVEAVLASTWRVELSLLVVIVITWYHSPQ